MNINRNNYEIYFLDYWEKQLSPQEVADLLVFLENNPDLKTEFQDFDDVSLTPDTSIVFNSKEVLKKQNTVAVNKINEFNYEQYFIDHVEKQLDEQQKSDLKLFLQKNKHLNKEFELFKQTILKPDNSKIFEDKSSLYQKKIFIYNRRFIYYAVSAAALILLLLAVYLKRDTNFDDQSRISKVDNENIIIEENISDVINNDEIIETDKKVENAKNPADGFVKSDNEKKTSPVTGSGKKFRAPSSAHISYNPIGKIKVAEINNDVAIADNMIINERDYIYEVFRDLHNANVNNDNASPPVEQNKTLISFAFAKIADLFRKNIPDTGNDGNITFWDIADAGITGYNKLTNKDVKLERQYSKDGDLVSLALVSDGVEIYRRKNPGK